MSWLISECLEILDPEEAPQVLEFAREVTRKRSLEQLGFDLVESADIDDSFSFNISGSSIWWSQFSGKSEGFIYCGDYERDSQPIPGDAFRHRRRIR